MEQEKVIVIDFGGQYNQLVARRVAENAMFIVRSILIKQILKRLKK